MQRALLHARTRQHRRAVEQAEWLIAGAMERHTLAVSFSGGKDSSVIRLLAQQLQPDVPVVWSDGGLELPETLALMEVVQPAYHVQSVTWWHRFPAAGRSPEAVSKAALCRREGWDGYILGLRAEESRVRAINTAQRGLLYRVQTGEYAGAWHCQPIARWSVLDVWAYLLTRGATYNAAYDRMDELGIPLERQRVGPPLDERAVAAGSMEVLRVGWPEQYAAWISAIPEGAAAAAVAEEG